MSKDKPILPCLQQKIYYFDVAASHLFLHIFIIFCAVLFSTGVTTSHYFKSSVTVLRKYRISSNKRPQRLLNFQTVMCGAY